MLTSKLLSACGGEDKLYVDDVFSTWLYSGSSNTALQIQNGIDLLGKGGMVWLKCRSNAVNHALFDTTRGVAASLQSNAANASSATPQLGSFNSNGFTHSATPTNQNLDINETSRTFSSWTFRKAPKFFDVVTYTGNGDLNQTISHSLGVAPGMIICKSTSNADNWGVWHRGTSGPTTSATGLSLNLTDAAIYPNSDLSSHDPVNSTSFKPGWVISTPLERKNTNGRTYVAYLFAHDTASDGLIQCGSFTTDGSGNATVNLGFEPQYLMFKNSTGSADNWKTYDTIRGFDMGTDDRALYPNLANQEGSNSNGNPTATGFQAANLAASVTYIYLAIRRPNKPPTTGTEVFNPVVYTGTNVDNRLVDTGILTDMVWARERNDTTPTGMVVGDRLRGNSYLWTGATSVENSDADSLMTPTVSYGNSFSAMNGFGVGNDATSKLNIDTTANNHVALAFKRAPGFFDVVCYTGTGSARTVAHSLGVAPELMIVKSRSNATQWSVYSAPRNATNVMYLNSTSAGGASSAHWNDTSPTASVFTVGVEYDVNGPSYTYAAYLFATKAGISKVGSYTGNGGTVNTNGTSQTINCGFSAGARFVLIKRTDSTGDWFVFDTARGIIAANDPYLLLNSTAAEVTTVDGVDTDNSGFIVNQTSGTNLNVTNATYLYFSVA